MRKLFFSLVALTAFSTTSLQAFNFFGCCGDSFGIDAEVRVAYYSPESHKVREIYGTGWADYQLELSKTIYGGWRGWLGVSGFSRHGHSIGEGDSTSFQLVPVSLGLKYDYCINRCLDVFVGGAASYGFLSIRDHSPYVHQHIHKGTWGGLVQTGAKYHFCDYAYVSAFFDYLFMQYDFHGSSSCVSTGYVERTNVNLNGYKVGVGLGLSF